MKTWAALRVKVLLGIGTVAVILASYSLINQYKRDRHDECVRDYLKDNPGATGLVKVCGGAVLFDEPESDGVKDDLPEFQARANQARMLPKKDLETQIDILYTSVMDTYDQEIAVRLDAYLFVYEERFPNSDLKRSINSEILERYGPCFAVPEGQCRE